MRNAVLTIVAGAVVLAVTINGEDDYCCDSDKLTVYDGISNSSVTDLDLVCDESDDCSNATVAVESGMNSISFDFSGEGAGSETMFDFDDVTVDMVCTGVSSCSSMLVSAEGSQSLKFDFIGANSGSDSVLEFNDAVVADALCSGTNACDNVEVRLSGTATMGTTVERRRLVDSGDGWTCTGDSCNGAAFEVSGGAVATLSCDSGCNGAVIELTDGASMDMTCQSGCSSVTIEVSDTATVAIEAEDTSELVVVTYGDEATCSNCESQGITVVEETAIPESTLSTQDGGSGGDDDDTTTQAPVEATTTMAAVEDTTTDEPNVPGTTADQSMPTTTDTQEDTTTEEASESTTTEEAEDAAYRTGFSLASLIMFVSLVLSVVF